MDLCSAPAPERAFFKALSAPVVTLPGEFRPGKRKWMRDCSARVLSARTVAAEADPSNAPRSTDACVASTTYTTSSSDLAETAAVADASRAALYIQLV